MLTFQRSMKIDFFNKTENILYLGFKFSSFVLKHVTQSLKLEFGKIWIKSQVLMQK